MARRIVDAGFPTTLWARRPASFTPFAGTAAQRAVSAAESAAASDLVRICVGDDADVEEAVVGDEGVLAGLRQGGVIAVHSTVHPDTCRRLADRARLRGVALVDAPVSGGGAAASEGRLLVMGGGGSGTVAYCRRVFETYGDPVVHLGPLGAGQVAKLLNNALFTANQATSADVLALGCTLDVDPAGLADVIAHGSVARFALGRVAAAGGTLARIAAHGGPLLRKDARLPADLAEGAGTAAGATVMRTADDALALMAQNAVIPTTGVRPVRGRARARRAG